MTKDLSKKLCEIVGIEPRERCIYYTGKEACKLNIPHSACVCECAESGYIYPDFGEPENFLKLLEIYFRINKLSEVCSIEDILKRIINSAEINCGTKRMIREAKWEYD